MQPVRLKRTAILISAGISFALLFILAWLPYSTENVNQLRSGRLGPKHLVGRSKIRELGDKELSEVHVAEGSRLRDLPLERNNLKNTDTSNIGAREEMNEARRKKVIEMMQHAWNGYKNYSWGLNEVRPVSKTPNTQSIFGGREMPATIVDAADTLWIMGLQKEYKEARDYIEEHFNMSKATGSMSVFETTIRFLGGLLSLYALTGEAFYIGKARIVAEALLPSFNTPTGIPKANVNAKTKQTSNYAWAGGSSILAEVGSLHLEFIYLSHVAGAPIFAKKVKKIRDVLFRMKKINGLYSNYIDPFTGTWSPRHHVSLGALGDSFYEYLIKSWLQSGKTDEQARVMYWDVSKAIRSQMVFNSSSGMTYVAEIRGGMVDHKMGHLACFSVGMFALQAANEKRLEEQTSTMQLAEELGRTCHESYIRTATHIGPEMFYFREDDEATSNYGENGYILRPEVIEGYFYLWRLTGKEKYRDWVWDAITSIDKYCRVEGGFAGLHNVYDPTKGHDDVQQSFFLAETLKYAYLTFTDKSVISLDQWVFNTEAHPLPIMDKMRY